ncbi:3-dehydroquinate synthase [Abyssalbus ytuae]|uniref:3-dehydroquinate synthase n=1 Tax=Abyssalbus ytuae TaxID=2926907 RepID=A0A9E7D377_9FLAO|nr:3-dehydroquinate synthase [Abyssalbus ytuae]UOB17544.1 3-dehydroquinate synthase [Abyssalbus ytuae]
MAQLQSIHCSDYLIHFGNESYNQLNKHLKDTNYSTIFILVDENTHNYCLPYFMSQITGDYNFEIIEIDAGEEFKNLETCSGVWSALSELGADRKSLIINLGGGVITDLGGFVASTFMRGINFINVPTTLLSMVDASVGGKTGVDLGLLKNQVGVFNNPVMVLIDSFYLKTLPHEQLRSGSAEMLKHGLIYDEEYWNKLKDPAVLNTKLIDDLIHRSVVIKNEIVLQDPHEGGLRKIVNFGHTLGHAIETYFLKNDDKKSLLHGEAIAIGMILAAYLSTQIENFPEKKLHEIKSTMLSYFNKVDFGKDDYAAIIDLMKFDKKNSHGNINFVLLKNTGQSVFDKKVSNELIIKAFEFYKN